MNHSDDILGALLAGGQSQRMGKPDKFFLRYRGKPLLLHAIERARPQVSRLIIAANGDLSRFNNYYLTTIRDQSTASHGPLAGIISAMTWGQKASLPFKWLATFASDTPHFPDDCVSRLMQHAQAEGLDVVVPRAGGRLHYAFALWSCACYPRLVTELEHGRRALKHAIQALAWGEVDFGQHNQAFFNVNTPKDWEKLMSSEPPL